MKPESSIKRYLGRETSESTKEEAKKGIEHKFSNPEVAAAEREKTPEEKEIIDIVNEATNKVLSEYGADPWDVPAENIHLFREEEWEKRKDKDMTAAYYNSLQGIIMGEIKEKTVLAGVLFHEMLHFKSFNGLELIDGKLKEQRSGIQMYTRPERTDILRGINEAVIEELKKRFVLSLGQYDLFKDEVSESAESKAAISGERSNPEVYYAKIISKEGKSLTYSSARVAYPEERENLALLMHKIRERNPDAFSSDEEVFSVFARALFKDNLLELGKLIDQTFGAGTFRKIAVLDREHAAFKELIDSL